MILRSVELILSRLRNHTILDISQIGCAFNFIFVSPDGTGLKTMSLARIDIEQHGADRWHAQVEIGGMVAKRREVNSSTFTDMMNGVQAAYREIAPESPDADQVTPTEVRQSVPTTDGLPQEPAIPVDDMGRTAEVASLTAMPAHEPPAEPPRRPQPLQPHEPEEIDPDQYPDGRPGQSQPAERSERQAAQREATQREERHQGDTERRPPDSHLPPLRDTRTQSRQAGPIPAVVTPTTPRPEDPKPAVVTPHNKR
jgi:hypothetical protein